MEKDRIRHIIVLTVLALAAATVWYSYSPNPRFAEGERTKALPVMLGQWTMSNATDFDTQVLAILGTGDIIGRNYTDRTGRNLRVVVVRAVNNRSAFHPPEYCLTGGGAEITGKRLAVVQMGGDSFKVNEMVFQTGEMQQFLVWNWYISDRKMTPNFYRQQWDLFREQLIAGNAPGIMINLYTDIEGQDIEAARKTCADFTSVFVPELKKLL